MAADATGPLASLPPDVTQLTGKELVEMTGRLSPLSPRARHLGLRMLEVHKTLLDDFPLPPNMLTEILGPEPGASRGLWKETLADLLRVAPGRLRAFDAVCDELARYAIERQELVTLTSVPVPLYRWVLDLGARLERQRPDVLRVRRSYEDLARQLRRARYLPPRVTREARRETGLILRYLKQWPTKAEMLAWRRRLGIDKDATLDKLKVWTDTAKTLVERLDTALTEHKRKCRDDLPRDATAVRYATRLLHARYPRIIANNSERLRRRIGW